MKKIFLTFFFLVVAGSLVASLAVSTNDSFPTLDPLAGSPERYYNQALEAEAHGNQIEALLALRRALILEPRLQVAQEHLEALLKKMGLPRETSWQTSVARSCSPELLVLIGSLVGWSAALLFVGMLFVALSHAQGGIKKRRWSKWSFIIVLFFFFAGHALAFLGNMIDPRMRAQSAMMITNAAPKEGEASSAHGVSLRNAPTDTASILVQLPSGTCITLLSQHGFWSYVKTALGQKGWVPSAALTPLIPSIAE